ncbi:wnt inhibitory factor 1-like isoform X2 [Hemicordylus capensis]|uniref:wnt inhibitory factor 1-like isoform X2 n=1 Tax=Hemicordylus capensis TaxID=884348 RepID=UPI0023020428|nr:wnt inhibitory factor 1-like isoform X2 [Hemicordylus capensis]
MGWRVAERSSRAPTLWLLFLASAGGPLLARALPGSKTSRGIAVPFVFDPRAVCSPPCQHGGLCIRNGTCFCSKGYEGELCQYVSCEGGCQNGGECISVNGVVKCLCASGWTGTRCQEAICPQGCWNGGICWAPGICSCATGWVGGACHLALCKLPCRHGGKCVAPDVCKCRSPYSGLQCTKRIKQ